MMKPCFKKDCIDGLSITKPLFQLLEIALGHIQYHTARRLLMHQDFPSGTIFFPSFSLPWLPHFPHAPINLLGMLRLT